MYFAGTTGNSITWHPSSEIPANYTIDVLEMGMPGPPFPVVWHANWTGGSITQNVDGWDEGTFYYTCIVYDTQGRNASSTVTVSIVPERLLVTSVVAGVTAGVTILIVAGIVDRWRGRPESPVQATLKLVVMSDCLLG
jgi:hypothetical protein